MSTSTNSKKAEQELEDSIKWSAKAAAVAHEAVDKVALKAAASEKSIREVAASSTDSLTKNKDKLQKQALTSFSKAKTMAKKNPLAAAGIAFTAGVLITAMLRRK
ncbi:hypothetical protein NBRC116493_10860 [Aurantivibrio infirmus]